MTLQAIHQYHNAVHKIYQFSGQNHEQAIKTEFQKLINHYCEKRNLMCVSEINIKNKRGEIIRPDGIVKNNLRLDCGYWESKANVDLEKEIADKINAGYPLTNTLFQDDKNAILFQNEQLCLKTELNNERELDHLLSQFVNYESQDIVEFNAAIEQFKKDLPDILNALRVMISEQEKTNKKFLTARYDFLEICQYSINPDITLNDVNEMLLQHILTEEIFTSIFSDAQFHRENNIAKELYKVESTFFSGTTKRNTLGAIQHYYAAIKSKAANIADHHDKQFFLKVIYENFYKAYNPKAADKLGIVYTPHEIVQFQIESVDTLLEKHFKKSLADEGIKILDPCTGTGTYLCDLIDYLPPHRLAYKYKYKHELFANELGLLSYYIANLNIEYTYQQKMGQYIEFEHICWVDTLDNMDFGLGLMGGINADLHDIGSTENTRRIKEQNKADISVIIGNPPYNANQQNENDNNKNRDYFSLDEKGKKNKTGGVDGRIKETYIKQSTAQKTKMYDMYSRFYRWASDRLKGKGIIAFITNNSFIESRTFDGFRKCVSEEFDFIYVIDLGGDMRKNTDTIDNVFGITIGVAILILVKTGEK
jgi:predicted helicase